MKPLILGLLLLTSNGHLLAQGSIPARAYQYRRTLHAEVERQWGLHLPALAFQVGAGTIHQESGWNPLAHSAYAQGLTQFTPESFADMRRLDPSISAGVWNPSAAIRAMAFYHHLLWTQTTGEDEDNHWAFVLSAYNGGLGNVHKDQKLAPNPQLWWDSVELKSGRSSAAFKENRGYVFNILKKWVPLYSTF